MTDKDLGFKKENLLVVRRPSALGEQQKTFMDEVKKLPGVINITHSTATPGHTNNYNAHWIEGQPTENSYLMQTFQVDEKFAETYEMEVAEGRFFSEDFATDSAACLINESAVNQFGWEAPYDFRILRPASNEGDFDLYNIVGVLKNFHFHSLHDRILPAIFFLKPEDARWGYISIRLSGENINQTVSQIETLWREFSDNDPLLSFFMDEDFDNQYQEDRRTGMLALIFSVLAILIASLGLFGLASFTAEQRTKEIGIRKVNGASAPIIVSLLSKESIILVGISTLIAWPAAYFVMKVWLQNFYFRVPWSPLPYLLSLGFVLIIAWLSVSYQAVKASRTNPAEALRYQ
jgi:putative ABC transport system permease protein